MDLIGNTCWKRRGSVLNRGGGPPGNDDIYDDGARILLESWQFSFDKIYFN